jgi:hypothetical protein
MGAESAVAAIERNVEFTGAARVTGMMERMAVKECNMK